MTGSPTLSPPAPSSSLSGGGPLSPLFELLESRGCEVLLVNARHAKNVSGRKSDVLDCQWLQQLLSYGLRKGADQPADIVGAS